MTILQVCKDRSNGFSKPIQRLSRRTSTAIIVMAVLVAIVSGCNSVNTQPTAILPTFSGEGGISGKPTNSASGQESVIVPTLLEPDHIWSERVVGASRVTITFYSTDTQSCIRLAVQDGQSSPIERCARSGDSLVAAQSDLTDSGGRIYTIVTGRILKDAITVVSIELDRGDNTPAELSDGGFFVALPGKRTAISVVPIDQYGNLVGVRYLFR